MLQRLAILIEERRHLDSAQGRQDDDWSDRKPLMQIPSLLKSVGLQVVSCE